VHTNARTIVSLTLLYIFNKISAFILLYRLTMLLPSDRKRRVLSLNILLSDNFIFPFWLARYSLQKLSTSFVAIHGGITFLQAIYILKYFLWLWIFNFTIVGSWLRFWGFVTPPQPSSLLMTANEGFRTSVIKPLCNYDHRGQEHGALWLAISSIQLLGKLQLFCWLNLSFHPQKQGLGSV
jgi:hypothetical protein